MKARDLVMVGIVALALGLLGYWQTPTVQAHGFIDQAWEGPPQPGEGSSDTILPPGTLGMEFTPSQPTLLGVDVSLVEANQDGDSTIDVRIREESINGVVLASASRQIPEGVGGNALEPSFFHFDLVKPLSVAPGQMYVMEVASSSNSLAWNGAEGHGGPGSEYPGGDAIRAGVSGGIDRFFRTYSAEQPPPSPTPFQSPTAVQSQTPFPSLTPSSSPGTATPTSAAIVTPEVLPATGAAASRARSARSSLAAIAAAATIVVLLGAAWYARRRRLRS